MKCHYKIYKRKNLIYFFTTTKRSLDNCLEIIQEKFNKVPLYEVFMNDQLVFKKVEATHPKKVLDKKTRIIYKSANALSKKTGLNYSTIRSHIAKNQRYVYYDGPVLCTD